MPQHLATQASDITRAKSRLRSEFGDRRSALDDDERRRQEALTLQHLQQFAPYLQAKTVALYAPIRSEFDIKPIAANLRARNVTTLYPRCRPQFQLEFAPATITEPGDWSVGGAFGVPEPQTDAVEAKLIDLIFVPLLAVDAEGHRLGYGGGYYDRWLARHPRLQAITVGVAYREQFSPQTLPFDDNDITLTWLASADGVHPTIS